MKRNPKLEEKLAHAVDSYIYDLAEASEIYPSAILQALDKRWKDSGRNKYEHIDR